MADVETGTPPEPENVTAGGEGEEEPEIKSEVSLVSKAVRVVALASLVCQIASIALAYSSKIVLAAGLIGAFIAPIVLVRQKQLDMVGSMRTVTNQLRQDVNDMKTENTKLSSSVDMLEGEVGRLKTVENSLQEITNDVEMNVDELVELCGENEMIQEKMIQTLTSKANQNMIQHVLMSDIDGDFTIKDTEVKRLSLQISNIFEISLKNDKLFESKLRELCGSVSQVLQYINAELEIARNHTKSKNSKRKNVKPLPPSDIFDVNMDACM